MLTLKQLEERGAQVACGRVIYKGKFVEGIWAEGSFAPAPGSPLPTAVQSRKSGKRAVAVAEATDVESKDAE